MTESEIDSLAEHFRAELSDEEEDLLDIEDNEAATVPPPRPHHHLQCQVCKPFYTCDAEALALIPHYTRASCTFCTIM